MFFELRRYQINSGKRDEFVRLMEEQIIPFQTQQGMSILGSFVAEEDDNTYVWIRRFDSEEERERLYDAVYNSDHWKTEIAPQRWMSRSSRWSTLTTSTGSSCSNFRPRSPRRRCG